MVLDPEDRRSSTSSILIEATTAGQDDRRDPSADNIESTPYGLLIT
jgi:hypothetical protein